jgi:hypothetical protein
VTGVWFGMDQPAPIMNRGFAAVVAVPAWAEFMKQATAKDGPDWFTQPADVEKVTICRLSGLRATEACRHGWMRPGIVQAGLTDLPGVPVGDMGSSPATGAVATVGRKPAAGPRSTVYDDYFPLGTAPTEDCTVHGSAGMSILSGDAGTSPGAASGGIIAASYPAGPAPSHLQKVVGADGRVVWVVKQ